MYTPHIKLWFFLHNYAENMKRWDKKYTTALAQVLELKDNKTQRSSTKKEAAPIVHSQTAKYDDDDSLFLFK